MPALSARLFALISISLGSLAYAADPVFTVVPDHTNGIYAPDEKVVWTVDLKGDRSGMNAVQFVVKKDGAGEVTKGTLDLSAGPGTITASRSEPGVLLAQIVSTDKTKPLPLAVGGAVISPDKIAPSAPAPADFDAFWQAKLKELATVPINPVVEKTEIPGVQNAEGIDYYKVTLDNIRGTHVHAQLARPTQGEKFPAMLVLQFAGVYALNKAQLVAQAKPGWLVLNVSAHDLPIDEPDQYYKDLQAGALKDYIFQGSEDKETSYFLRMFLGCVRGAEYLASRPDWDGKILVVTGSSQGGLQSFATAALCPKITAVMTMVPAGCDNYATLANPARAFGWPYWLSNWGPKDRDMKKVQQTAGYFDGDYFAARVHCPTLIAVGLIDDTARPAGVLAAYNAITAPKELQIMVGSDHHGSGGTQAIYYQRFGAWKTALQKGEPLPIPVASADVPAAK